MRVSNERARQAGNQLGGSRVETGLMPEWAFKLRPQAHQSMIVGDQLHTLPKFRAQFVRVLGMRKRFAVQPAFLPADLQANTTEHLAARALQHLKFFKSLFQVVCRQPFRTPQRREFWKVVNRRAADLRLHAHCKREEASSLKMQSEKCACGWRTKQIGVESASTGALQD